MGIGQAVIRALSNVTKMLGPIFKEVTKVVVKKIKGWVVEALKAAFCPWTCLPSCLQKVEIYKEKEEEEEEGGEEEEKKEIYEEEGEEEEKKWKRFEIRLILTYLIRLDLVYFGSEAMVSSSSDLQYVCSPALFSLLPVPVCSGGSRPDSPETTFNAVLFGDIMARHLRKRVGEPMVRTAVYERGTYECLDPNSFKTVRKEQCVVQYEHMEKRPSLLQH
ncbi:hypothetical protein Bca52824_022540 [Brassica carinata]|uniref:Uncharacterized protein n=1 Tax=Brassica carinata TaxID=52824 RepID=A0A8X7VG82_BRACI|nr:hypothetical protein Bca52824_022540 [Brassica carinata]